MATTTKTEINVVPGTPQITMSRAFDAPRELLYRAYTEPKLLERWLGPRRMTMTVVQQELRDGGVWRFVHRGDDGSEHGFHGVFHGNPSPNGIVRTFEYEGYPGHISLESLTFEERDGQTIVHTNSVYQSVEDRDGMVESGMESGVTDSMEKLDELLVELQQG